MSSWSAIPPPWTVTLQSLQSAPKTNNEQRAGNSRERLSSGQTTKFPLLFAIFRGVFICSVNLEYLAALMALAPRLSHLIRAIVVAFLGYALVAVLTAPVNTNDVARITWTEEPEVEKGEEGLDVSK
ncbi:hypothetical protein BDK51DRAFT_46167 [Blyttiomyces helicus]|uniref:Uncharacterized protein n=1 Tax=Blyttiomyces helicus TaxID=388810 RepID=A0A4V1IPE2_9FUNG|nr:hypothetical protein BDK51DRAFT_46167 [Blyttiomyces helicus]|eukprot:RKO82747.1 hypothetical protein BDK51DRAFT_46167 [Blyttiomyces helicus]